MKRLEAKACGDDMESEQRSLEHGRSLVQFYQLDMTATAAYSRAAARPICCLSGSRVNQRDWKISPNCGLASHLGQDLSSEMLGRTSEKWDKSDFSTRSESRADETGKIAHSQS